MVDRTREAWVSAVAVLKGDATLAGLVGARVYDRVPNPATYPFVSVECVVTGPLGEYDDRVWELVLRITGWARDTGTIAAGDMATRISRAIYTALQNAALALADDGAAPVTVLCRAQTGSGRVIRDAGDEESVRASHDFHIITDR